MKKSPEIPRKGQRIRLAGLDPTFVVFAIRKQAKVVDLQPTGDASRLMYDVPWDALQYLDEADATKV